MLLFGIVLRCPGEAEHSSFYIWWTISKSLSKWVVVNFKLCYLIIWYSVTAKKEAIGKSCTWTISGFFLDLYFRTTTQGMYLCIELRVIWPFGGFQLFVNFTYLKHTLFYIQISSWRWRIFMSIWKEFLNMIVCSATVNPYRINVSITVITRCKSSSWYISVSLQDQIQKQKRRETYVFLV